MIWTALTFSPTTVLIAAYGQIETFLLLIFIISFKLMPKREILPGIILSFFIIKLQLIFIPILFLITISAWRCLFVMGVSTLLIIVATASLLGTEVWYEFGNSLVDTSNSYLAGTLVPWHIHLSSFAAMKSFGLPSGTALIGHLVVLVGLGLWLYKCRSLVSIIIIGIIILNVKKLKTAN